MALIWANTRAAAGLASKYLLPNKEAYRSAVAEIEAAFLGNAVPGTHVLLVGVGKYNDTRLPSLTTSIHGARAFADWLLSNTYRLTQPLASLTFLESPPEEVGPWIPSDPAAEALGVGTGKPLSLPPATKQEVQESFDAWLRLAGSHDDNAAFLYLAGHGVWRASTYFLPQDARLPSAAAGPRNLIDIRLTLSSMFNAKPGVQCFFVDACQSIERDLSLNLAASVGESLYLPATSVEIPQRDASIYYGSYMGLEAYGPNHDPPYFTQELIRLLARGGAERRRGGHWRVTTDSLRKGLLAAGHCRAEETGQPIKFSHHVEASSMIAELCRYEGPSEAILKVWCAPKEATKEALFEIRCSASPVLARAAHSELPWHTRVPSEAVSLLARFDPASPFRAPDLLELVPQPPVEDVELEVGK